MSLIPLPKIDDGTAVPIAWLFKAFGFILTCAGVIWWGATLTANVKTIQQSVEPIQEMQRDIAVLKSRMSSTGTITRTEMPTIPLSSLSVTDNLLP